MKCVTLALSCNQSTHTAFQVDLKEAVSCFQSMGFEVVVERNLHYVDMMRLLSRVAQGSHSIKQNYAQRLDLKYK